MGSLTLSYDNNGNTLIDYYGHHLQYDAWNHIGGFYNDNGSGGTGTLIKSFAYDGIGRRITETLDGQHPRETFFSAAWQDIEESISDSGMQLSSRTVYSHVYVD